MAMLPVMSLLLLLPLLLIHASPSPSHLSPTFLPNYHKMLQTFKIHIYNHTTTQPITYQDPTASHFYNLLLRSPFLTPDPAQAHLFFLPFSFPSLSSSPRPLARLIREIRASLPFWNRTLGADHFHLSCPGPTSGSSSDRNLLELRKNSIQITCFPTTKSSSFIPHKDITLPPLTQQSTSVNASVNVHWMGGDKYCLLGYEDGNIERVGEVLWVSVVVVGLSGGVGYGMPFMDVVRWGEVAVFMTGKRVGWKDEVRYEREGGERMRELGATLVRHSGRVGRSDTMRFGA